MTTARAHRPDWGNLELNLAPIPPATPAQQRAAQRAVLAWAPDATVASELLEALGLNHRIDP